MIQRLEREQRGASASGSPYSAHPPVLGAEPGRRSRPRGFTRSRGSKGRQIFLLLFSFFTTFSPASPPFPRRCQQTFPSRRDRAALPGRPCRGARRCGCLVAFQLLLFLENEFSARRARPRSSARSRRAQRQGRREARLAGTGPEEDCSPSPPLALAINKFPPSGATLGTRAVLPRPGSPRRGFR